jgi:hypothetical protein
VKPTKLYELGRLREFASLEKGSFGNGYKNPGDPLPKTEAQVDEFIRRRTRLYLQTWVLPKIDELIEAERVAVEKRKARRK